MRWSTHRGRLRELSDDIKRAKRERDEALARLRVECERQRKAIQADCAAGRKQIRGAARSAERKARQRKRKLWETYRIFSGSIRGQLERQYSADEHDSLTEHNIAPRYLEFFRAHRSLFPRWRSPDDRAVHFGEYVESHENEIAAWYAAQQESREAQGAYQRAYFDHLEERGDLEDGQLDGDDGPGGPGLVYVDPPEGDPVLKGLHIIAAHERTKRGGADVYAVTVSGPEGEELKFTAEEGPGGRWSAKMPRGGPRKVRAALRNWVESGALAPALVADVPF